MNKLTFQITCLIIAITISCQTEIVSDPDYPSKTGALDYSQYLELEQAFQRTPLAQFSALDSFGIPYLKANYKDSIADFPQFAANKTVLIQLFKETMFEYGSFMHCSDTADISINNISTIGNIEFDQFITQYPDSMPVAWKVVAKQQIYNKLRVNGTTITMLITASGAVGCSGRWYNDIYLPDSLNYSEEEAMNIVSSKTLSYKSKTYKVTETTVWHQAAMLITPIRKEKEIELHLCHALYPDTWQVLIDSQSGEVLSAVNLK